MKNTFGILILVLFFFGLSANKAFTVKSDNYENRLKLKFSIQEDTITTSTGYFHSTILIMNISNDTIVIPASYWKSVGCGDFHSDIYLEIFYFNGEKYIPTGGIADIDDFTIYNDINFKPGDTIVENTSLYNPEIHHGCPLNDNGIFNIRVSVKLPEVAGKLSEIYYSNFDTIVVI